MKSMLVDAQLYKRPRGLVPSEGNNAYGTHDMSDLADRTIKRNESIPIDELSLSFRFKR